MVTEVFGRIGEAEIHEEHSNFHRRYDEDGETPESSVKFETPSKNLSNAKKEYFEHLEDDSLTVDTCDKLNHDWEKK